MVEKTLSAVTPWATKFVNSTEDKIKQQKFFKRGGVRTKLITIITIIR